MSDPISQAERATDNNGLNRTDNTRPERKLGSRQIAARGTQSSFKTESDQDTNAILWGLFDKVFPVGQRMHLDLQGSITWGVPIYTEAMARVELERKRDGTGGSFIEILAIKEVGVGADTGIGAELFIGSKKGVGANLGVEVKAGKSAILMEKFEIPTDDLFQGYALFVIGQNPAVTAVRVGQQFNVLPSFIDNFMSNYANRYQVSTKVEVVGVKKSIEGAAEIGVREGTEKTKSDKIKKHTQVWKKGQNPERLSQKTKLLSPKLRKILSDDELIDELDFDPIALAQLLSIRFEFLLSLEISVSVEVENTNATETNVKLEIEGALETLAIAKIPIPYIEHALRVLGVWQFPEDNIGVGAVAEFKFHKDKLINWKLGVYQFTGEDDYLIGPASKQVFHFGFGKTSDETKKAIKSIVKGDPEQEFNLNENLIGCSFFNRTGVNINASELLRFSKKPVTPLHKSVKSKKKINFTIEAYLETTIEINAGQLISLSKELMKSAPAIKAQFQNTKLDNLSSIQGLSAFMVDFGESLIPMSFRIQDFLRTFPIEQADLIYMFAPGVSGSGKLAAGAKASLELSTEVGFGCRYSNSATTMGKMIDEIINVLENPIKYLPNCQAIKLLYDILDDEKAPVIPEGTKKNNQQNRKMTSKANRSTSPPKQTSSYEKIVQEWILNYDDWKTIRPGTYRVIVIDSSENIASGDYSNKAIFIIAAKSHQQNSSQIIRFASVVQSDGYKKGDKTIKPTGNVQFVDEHGSIIGEAKNLELTL